MNYSEEITHELEDKDIEPMDKIQVKRKGKTYKGVLMPNTDMSSPNCITIKLDNGYNVGIEHTEETEIEKLEEREKEEKELEVKQDKSKPPISIISTGGTISSKVDYETGGVKPALTAEEIIADVPEVMDHAYVRNYEQISQIASEDIGPDDWKKIAKTVEKELNNGSRGVVITHGTDTMHYSSAALSFMLKNLSKPVVLTGAQRSIDRGSTDAAMNLICSSIVAAKSDIGEVGIVMHGTMNDDKCLFIRGTKVKKMHTSRRDTFRPINDVPIAEIDPEGNINKLQAHKNFEDKEVKAENVFEDKVAVIKTYPGSDPSVISHYEDQDYEGYILEGTGLGHVPTEAEETWIPKIKEVTEKDKPVVGTSQCTYGRVNPNVYANLRKLYHEAGAEPGRDMTTETAYVKLGWLLAKEEDNEEVKRKMKKNLRGEINERSLPKTFLY